MSEQIYFNPWDEGFRANPYPHYQAFIGRPPQLLNMFFPIALIGSYADAVAILHDPARFSSDVRPLDRVEVFGDAPRLLFADPPTHTRLRKLVSRAFTPRRISDLEPKIREFTAHLLEHAAAKGEFELMADLAVPLPVMVIAEMLGVPPADYEKFKTWSDAIIDSDNTLPGTPLPPVVAEAFAALRHFFIGEIAKRRQRPGPDLVSALVAARDESDALSEEELIAFVILLLLAGNETTTNLIGNGMLALMRHPEQIERLRVDPSLTPRAIEEMLRYDPPAQSVVRITKEDVVINGVEIKADSAVFVVVAAANRDPAHFANPETFDITRHPNDHLAFGDGIHFCLGAALARLEGTIAFTAMLARFPHLSPLDAALEPKYKGSYFLRGLADLRVAIA
ncbi:MAG TPA: cytochrome P450 [Candidatus Binataceae bacterium]|nr:cytochrome P450 [Candidatus Binataceae bacterium]